MNTKQNLVAGNIPDTRDAGRLRRYQTVSSMKRPKVTEVVVSYGYAIFMYLLLLLLLYELLLLYVRHVAAVVAVTCTFFQVHIYIRTTTAVAAGRVYHSAAQPGSAAFFDKPQSCTAMYAYRLY